MPPHMASLVRLQVIAIFHKLLELNSVLYFRDV
jgi:hypothetical protein